MPACGEVLPCPCKTIFLQCLCTNCLAGIGCDPGASGMQAWDTLTWFAALIGMASFLNKFGFIAWFSSKVGCIPGTCLLSRCLMILEEVRAVAHPKHHAFRTWYRLKRTPCGNCAKRCIHALHAAGEMA